MQLLQVEKAVNQVVCTQDPLTNDEVNRFYEVLEALDFHAKELKNRFNKPNLHEYISKDSIDLLLILAMNKINAEAKHTLLDPFPVSANRFALKLEYLLTPE